jgi:hypothetical protein
MNLKLAVGLSLMMTINMAHALSPSEAQEAAMAKWIKRSDGKCYRMDFSNFGAPNYQTRARLEVNGHNQVKVLRFSTNIPKYTPRQLQNVTIDNLHEFLHNYLKYPDMHQCESKITYSDRGIPKRWSYFCQGKLYSELSINNVDFFRSKDPAMGCEK